VTVVGLNVLNALLVVSEIDVDTSKMTQRRPAPKLVWASSPGLSKPTSECPRQPRHDTQTGFPRLVGKNLENQVQCAFPTGVGYVQIVP
jgi:hypothetical protein